MLFSAAIDALQTGNCSEQRVTELADGDRNRRISTSPA